MRHFAYPIGKRRAAGPREFELAAQGGFTTAVTTRPGMLFAPHAAHRHALPRLSLNGRYQSFARSRDAAVRAAIRAVEHVPQDQL